MTVREFICKLKEFDPDAEVLVSDWNEKYVRETVADVYAVPWLNVEQGRPVVVVSCEKDENYA